MKFIDNWFPASYKSTMEIDKKKKQITVGQRPIQLFIWDTPGDLKRRETVVNCFEEVDAILFMYDPNDKQSFDKIFEVWKTDTHNLKVIVGNINSKDQAKRQISYLEAKQVAELQNYLYYEVNVKESKDINKLFSSIAEILIQIFDKQVSNILSHDENSL